MVNYRQTNVSGESWQRCTRVVIENPLNGTPSVNFIEEKVVNLGDQYITTPCDNLTLSFDATAEFPLVDPVTGEVPVERTSMSHFEVYAVLNSLYIYLAKKRDEVFAMRQLGVPQ